MLPSEQVERYEILRELAVGGMGTVYLAKQHGAFGFNRIVAIKSMHPQYAKDDTFRSMFLDEALLTAKIRHPNVVPTLDVVSASNKLLLVMEYVEGVALSVLFERARRAGQRLPLKTAVAIVVDVLHGLHAAHELAENGASLGVVHRDVSPHNVMVGSDGLARVLDFGIAKASDRRTKTRTGEVKGKLAYMAPEQLFGEEVDRRADLYAVGVVLWEGLAGRRLFDAPNDGALTLQVTQGKAEPVGFYAEEEIPEALDRALLKAIARDRTERFTTAEEMAAAFTAAVTPATPIEVKRVLASLATDLVNRGTDTAFSLDAEARAVQDLLTDQVHVTTSMRKAASRGLSPGIAAVLAVAGTLALVGGGSWLLRAPKPALGPVAETTTAPVASLAPVVIPSPEPTPAAEPSKAPIAAATTAKPHVGGPVKRAGTTAQPSASAPAPTTNPRCVPPYDVDEAGHRHYKPECFP